MHVGEPHGAGVGAGVGPGPTAGPIPGLTLAPTPSPTPGIGPAFWPGIGHLPHAASHGHGGHFGAHPNYVTPFVFLLFRAIVNNKLIKLQNSNNQIKQ